jgi:hypothetical protein
VLWALAASCGGSAATGKGPDGGGTGGGAQAVGIGGTGVTGGGLAGGGLVGGGLAGGGGVGGGAVAGTPVPLDGSPVYARLVRLTNAQWMRAVRDILQLDAAADLTRAFAASVPVRTEFTNNEKNLFVDQQAQLDFEAGAEAATTLAIGSADALARLYAGTDAAGFVRTIGRRAFRRPLTAEEEATYQAVFALGESMYGRGFSNGAGLVIRALLESPKFLYRSELVPGGAPLDGYEAASKLSFLLLDTTPSDSLLDQAAAGDLDSADGLEAAARALLEQPAAVAVARDFHRQLYRLDRYDVLDDAWVAPALRAEMTEASNRFFDAVFTGGEGLRAILTSPRYFVGAGLAPIYGVDPPPDAVEERTAGGGRIGYFMQAPFLTARTDDGGESDPIRRGDAIENDVLCVTWPAHTIAASTLPRPAAGQTNRSRVEQATNACGGCHTDYIDPLGFAFEGFDGLGRARAIDNGATVTTAGSYPFADGVQSFADASELMRLLADLPQAHACYAKKMMTYALQRDLVEADRPEVTELGRSSAEQSVKELLVALIRSPAFRVRAEEMP